MGLTLVIDLPPVLMNNIAVPLLIQTLTAKIPVKTLNKPILFRFTRQG